MMPKVFFKILLPFVFSSGVFAYDFSHCIAYYNEATIPVGKSRSISIKTPRETIEVIFSLTTPQDLKILKADPFVGLYLVQGKTPHYSYHFKNIDSYVKNTELSAIGLRYAKKGKVLRTQKGFVDYAEFSSLIPRNGVISNICYQIYGLGVGGKYFIDKKYLDRFLSEKSAYYGDIGVRVIQKDKYILVRQIDPFFPDNPFLLGDVIVSINGKNINSYEDFEWTASNLPYKKIAQIDILRNNQKQKLNVVTDKHYGGFLLPDTFLERFGITLDKTLTITDINEDSKNKLNLKLGDKIIWIGNKRVLKDTDDSTQKANDSLRSALSQAGIDKNMEILIMRNGLELRLKLQEK